MVKYRVFRERFSDECGKMRTVYGIKAIENGLTVEAVSDICCKYIPVVRLCIRCNRLKLDAVHLRDVAEDFAAEY